MSASPANRFTSGPLSALYLKVALPIIFVMSMHGLISVVDAMFLGIYVGPAALAAVTLMFPIYLMIVALSALVSTGMSSLLARRLGAEDLDGAREVFAGAHGLAIALSAVLIVLFFAFGHELVQLVAGGAGELAEMGLIYLRITVICAPLAFVLSIHSDALRNEGRIGLMAAMSLLVSIGNITFNFIFIVLLDMGVAGSAYGTAVAQSLALCSILSFRVLGNTPLPPGVLRSHSLRGYWGRIVALGTPPSLNYVGLALGSAAVIVVLQWIGQPGYADTISAYGIITRLITFVFLPLLGLSVAMQTITGNNYGARLWHRSDRSLQIALAVSLLYCLIAQAIAFSLPDRIAGIFIDDPRVISEVARILPIVSCMFFLVGPLMMLTSYFQAIGFAARSALLGLSRAYAFGIPLTFVLPLWFGEVGIWYAGPSAEVLLLGLALILLWRNARRSGLAWGIFHGHNRIA